MTPTPEELQACWNENRGNLLEWLSLKINNRRRLAEDRLRETPDLPRWRAAIIRASRSAFCTGGIPDKEGRVFVAGPDWILKPETLTLLEEGTFDNRVLVAPSPAEIAANTSDVNYRRKLAGLPPRPDDEEVFPIGPFDDDVPF